MSRTESHSSYRVFLFVECVTAENNYRIIILLSYCAAERLYSPILFHFLLQLANGPIICLLWPREMCGVNIYTHSLSHSFSLARIHSALHSISFHYRFLHLFVVGMFGLFNHQPVSCQRRFQQTNSNVCVLGSN